MNRITQIFVGQLQPLPPEGQRTGMFKAPVTGAVALGPEGLAGDQVADRRVHGGPDQAVHHYPAEHYATLAARFPAASGCLAPGCLGENLSGLGWTETNVCLGDVFGLGPARLQVSRPRNPCWKINHRLGEKQASRFIAEAGITGWYYRVLAGGTVAPGDTFELLERVAAPIALADAWRIQEAHRPPRAALAALVATPGLAAGWRQRLAERLAWLDRNPELPL